MELYEQIISKKEINARAVEALLAIIANGLVASKSDLAECLGAKPSKFSEILNYRMNVGVDMIAKICDWYYVDPDWLLMGRGNKIFRNTDHSNPYFIEDDNNLDRQYHITKVKEEDKPKYGKTVGTGTLIIGISLVLGFIVSFWSEIIIDYIILPAVIVGLGFILYGQFKYNKGIF